MRRLDPRILSFCLFAGFTALARSQSASPARPAYQFLRFQENWSVVPRLAPGDRDDFDAFKFVPLDAAGSTWVSFGGDFRARAETWQDFNFGAPATANHDDTFILSRVRAHADLHFAQASRFFLELKSAHSSDRDLPGGIRVIDEDEFELQQAFVDLRFNLDADATLVLRAGRQALGFGAQRLVSALPWANALRTWDGVQAILTTGDWTVTAFGAAFVPVQRAGVGEANEDERLYGVYARRVFAGPPAGLELYALRNEWPPRAFNGTVGEDRRWTFGLRQWAPLGSRADYEYEASFQTGETGSGDVTAWSWASQLGYQVRPDKSLRLWAGLDWASGDDRAGGEVETFNALYPLGHAYFGALDMIGRQNILDTSVGATWRAHPKVIVNLGWHLFRADSTADAIYNAGGGVVRPGGSYRSASIGHEFNLTARWNAGRHVVFDAGYGRFFAGRAIEQSGPARDIDFWYVETTCTF